MNTKRFTLVVTAAVLLTLLLGACAPAATEVAAEPIKVALVLSGPISDASWNAAAYNGVLALEDKFDIELQYTENVGLPDIEPTYRDYASKGFDVIIGHGFQFGDPAVAVSPEYPDTKFGVVMGIAEADNVMSLNFREEESSYLAGYLAASRSKTGVIGGVGGEQIPSIVKSMEAAKLGAKAANPDAKMLITYTGTWTDPNAGYEAAMAQISNEADVLFPIANLTSTGVYKAGTEKGVMMVGTEGDQCAVDPKNMIGSTTEEIDRVIEIMMTDVAAGTFKGGLNFLGLKEGALDVIICKDGGNPPELVTKLEELRKQIEDGTLVVPAIMEPTE